MSLIPRWVSWQGLAQHVAVGAGIAVVAARVGQGPWVGLTVCLVVGLGHEWLDGDFTDADGAPWNGILDALAFLPVPIVWLILR